MLDARLGSNCLIAAAAACALGAGCTADAAVHEVAGKSQALTTTNCSEDQAQHIQAAVDGAQQAVFGALLDLSAIGGGGDTSRFDYWFGTHDPQIVDWVHHVFMNAMTDVTNVEYICNACDGDADDFYGAVTGNIGDGMKLCSGYFSHDAYEFGVGTILHEMAHLNGVPPDYFNVCSFPDVVDSKRWPDGWHEYAVMHPGSEGATLSPENYRLYGLDWGPGEESTITWCP